MNMIKKPQATPRRTLSRSFSALAAALFATCVPLSAQTQTITVNANSVVREVPAGLGGVCGGSDFWNSLKPNYRDDMIKARISLVRIVGYPSQFAGGSLQALDAKVAQILNSGAKPFFIQCIASNNNTAFKNVLYRADGTFYPAGDTTPVATRVATNLTFLVKRYKAPPFNLDTQYWEIGNEPDRTDVSYGVSTTQEYVNFFTLAHNHLDAANVRENVLLAGPATSYEYGFGTGNHGYNIRDAIMQDFLAACGNQVDIVTRHVYGQITPSWELIANTPYNQLNHSKEMAHFDHTIVTTRGEYGLLALINANTTPSPSSTGTGITEMNLFHDTVNIYNHTITQGLWFLLSDHFTLYNPRSYVTTGFQFDRNNHYLAYYRNVPDINGNQVPTPSFPYWASYIHGVLTGDQMLAQTSSNSHLVVTASKDESYLYVRVVNRHDTASYTANVTINNAPPVTAATRFNFTATATPDVGIATAHGTSFTETFAPFTASVFRFPRTDAPVPPTPAAAPYSPHFVTSFDTVPAGMLTYANGFTPVVASGRLQLTAAAVNQSSAVVFNGQPLTASTQRLQARFGFKVVHPNAEGIVFGAYSANPGAVGASGQALGYVTQNNRLWGVKIDNNPDQISVISNVTNDTADGWATKALSPYANLDLFAVIDYDGVAGTVRARLYQGTDDTGAFLADLTNSIGNPASLPAGTVFGFTGATGSYVQTTYIESLSILLDDFALGQEVILDNTSGAGVTITGSWAAATIPNTYHGTNYLHDGNTGKGAKSVRYTPALTGTGWRDVYLRWPQFGNWSAAAPITVVHADGTTPPSLTINQTTGSSQWVKIGTFRFNAGSSGYVQINTNGTTTYVAADAVRFVNVAAP